jgi:hypothetical protein
MTWQDDIRDTADALTDSYIHRAATWDWDHNRKKKIRYWQTVQPGLLAQLYNAVHPTTTPGDGTGGGGKPSSRPPLALEALSVYDEITTAIRSHCRNLGLELQPTAESNLRRLAGKAMSFDETDGKHLLADLRRWQRWCLVMTGWEHVRALRHVTCPDCRERDTIRLNLTTETAGCRNCAAAWSAREGTLHTLAHTVTG